ncbi:prephenate dehydratase [Synchytrium microbalum]|uniref:prephenate dehydratase n=1 Tax=Synchytrium microbalum TaxID=1806994 RepID=A0A507CC53_9FUNG|nr:prephenate dehydratase [Synchytrium microbalum]TPX36749.1 prephenate dehydratase [Synchytrium microbalum]
MSGKASKRKAATDASPQAKRSNNKNNTDDDIESTSTLSYLGPPGSHSHAAAMSLPKTSPTSTEFKLVQADTIASVFENLVSGKTQYALVPWENSRSGSVTQALDAFKKFVGVARSGDDASNGSSEGRIQIVNDLYHVVHQSVLGVPNPDGDWKSTITNIYSHPEALSQVKMYLDECFLPSNTHSKTTTSPPSRVPVSSTSHAAQLAANSPHTSIAICSTVCAELYNLKVLQENVEDANDNTTRFLLVTRSSASNSNADTQASSSATAAPTLKIKTHLMMTLKQDENIATVCCKLGKGKDIMVTKIDSRPSGLENWNYTYYIEIISPSPLKLATEVKSMCSSLHVLGSYQMK